MGRNQLIRVFRKHEVTNLRTSVDVVYWLKKLSVPKSNTSISGTSSCCENTSLVRIPTDSLYCSLMLRKSGKWLSISHVPYE